MGYDLIGVCTREECLLRMEKLPEYPVGLATLRGFYTQVEQKWFDGKMYLCDSFVVVEGSPELVRAYLSLVEEGNTVYSKDKQGRLVFSLNMDGLTEEEKSRILSSTQESTVELLVLARPATFMGAPPCYSHLDILRVK